MSIEARTTCPAARFAGVPRWHRSRHRLRVMAPDAFPRSNASRRHDASPAAGVMPDAYARDWLNSLAHAASSPPPPRDPATGVGAGQMGWAKKTCPPDRVLVLFIRDLVSAAHGASRQAQHRGGFFHGLPRRLRPPPVCGCLTSWVILARTDSDSPGHASITSCNAPSAPDFAPLLSDCPVSPGIPMGVRVRPCPFLHFRPRPIFSSVTPSTTDLKK